MGKITDKAVKISEQNFVTNSWAELTYLFPDLKIVRKNGTLAVILPPMAFSPLIVMDENQTKVLMLKFNMPITKEEQKKGLIGYKPIEYRSRDLPPIEEIFDF